MREREKEERTRKERGKNENQNRRKSNIKKAVNPLTGSSIENVEIEID